MTYEPIYTGIDISIDADFVSNVLNCGNFTAVTSFIPTVLRHQFVNFMYIVILRAKFVSRYL